MIIVHIYLYFIPFHDRITEIRKGVESHGRNLTHPKTKHHRNGRWLHAECLKATERRFGPITDKYVIYRGESCEVNGIYYLNVEEYLKGLAYLKSKLWCSLYSVITCSGICGSWFAAIRMQLGSRAQSKIQSKDRFANCLSTVKPEIRFWLMDAWV